MSDKTYRVCWYHKAGHLEVTMVTAASQKSAVAQVRAQVPLIFSRLSSVTASSKAW